MNSNINQVIWSSLSAGVTFIANAPNKIYNLWKGHKVQVETKNSLNKAQVC